MRTLILSALLLFSANLLRSQTVTSVMTPVTINGTGFVTGATVANCTNVVFVSATTLTASCPAGTQTVVVTNPATANPISVNFVGLDVAMAATETAGVVPVTNWNNATGASTVAGLALKDSTGAATSATIVWSCDDLWQLPITDAPGNVRMMKGYCDNNSATPTTITVSGLPANSLGYQVYVYADGDNGALQRTGNYTVGTTKISAIDLANTNFSGTFTQANNSAGNYVMFTVTGTGFTLGAIGTSTDAQPRAPVNGIQIVPITTVAAPTVALKWTPSVSVGVTGYNVYRGTASGGPYGTKLTPTPVAASPYVDTTVQPAQTYYYVVTAYNPNASPSESVYSGQAIAVIP